MIYFTSDNHFWHSNILKYCPGRPFKSVEEMNEGMVRDWNSVVTPEDEIIHVGDFSLAIRPVETYTPRLNGKKTLVSGNHDWTHPYHKKARKDQAKWIGHYHRYGWETVAQELSLELPELGRVRVCHLPYTGAKDHHLEDKYQNYRPVDDGTTLICGHVHQSWKHQFSPKGTLMVNVGVDVWGKPVSSLELVAYIKEVLRGSK